MIAIFFLADVLSYALWVVRPRRWTLALAVSMQLGSASAYSDTLFGVSIGPFVGALFVSVAVAIVVVQLFRPERFDEPPIAQSVRLSATG